MSNIAYFSDRVCVHTLHTLYVYSHATKGGQIGGKKRGEEDTTVWGNEIAHSWPLRYFSSLFARHLPNFIFALYRKLR